MPGAPYQCHASSLKALVYVLKMETSADKAWGNRDDTLFFDAFDETWSRALVDLLMDPFDDVRSLSSQALDAIFSEPRFKHFIPDAAGQAPASRMLHTFLGRADDLATRTARADHADGVARTSQLLYNYLGSTSRQIDLLASLVADLEESILLAEADLARAVLEAPVHGKFASLWSVRGQGGGRERTGR